MPEKPLSDLKLERHECPKCKAVWINGVHTWGGTGNPGNELDLAGLVCNKFGDEHCINPSKGIDGGQTWEERSGWVDGAMFERKKMLKELDDRLKGL